MARAWRRFPIAYPIGLTPPPGALARGFTKNLLYTDFSATGLSSIDVNNTGAPNFQWWVQNSWTDGGFPGVSPTPASAFTQVAGGVAIAAANSANSSMMSVFGTGGAGFYGNMVNAGGVGFYAEFTCKLTPGASSGNPHTALWLIQTVYALDGAGGTKSPEFDVLEVIDSSNQLLTNIHEWLSGADQGQLTDPNQVYGTLSDSNLHTYGVCVTPPSLNGGVDKRELWLDGVHLSSMDVTWSSTGTCAASTAPSTVGLFSSSESTPLVLLVGGPIACLAKVQAWGPP